MTTYQTTEDVRKVASEAALKVVQENLPTLVYVTLKPGTEVILLPGTKLADGTALAAETRVSLVDEALIPQPMFSEATIMLFLSMAIDRATQAAAKEFGTPVQVTKRQARRRRGKS